MKLKFRDEGNCDCAFDFACFEKGERKYNSQAEKDFEEMLLDAADWLGLEREQEAYRISEGQEQFLRGAAAGFCFAANQRLGSGHCFASLHVLC